MTTIDALDVLTTQHAQIDDLFDFVSMLRDPDALSELADALSAHLAAESDLLYGALADQLRPEVLEELRAEHIAIKRTLAELVWFGVADPELDSRLSRLGALLDGHVGYQEDELFPTAATVLSAEVLAQLGIGIAHSARPFLHECALPLAS
jgi:hypothetical protein